MSDEDPHKRMRRFGELCGYFYGRRFFGLETIMSDRDSGHMLLELQEARAEIDRLRELLRWRKWPEEKPMVNEDTYFQVIYTNSKFPNHDIFFLFKDGPRFSREDISHWRPIGPLPGVGGEQ